MNMKVNDHHTTYLNKENNKIVLFDCNDDNQQ